MNTTRGRIKHSEFLGYRIDKKSFLRLSNHGTCTQPLRVAEGVALEEGGGLTYDFPIIPRPWSGHDIVMLIKILVAAYIYCGSYQGKSHQQ